MAAWFKGSGRFISDKARGAARWLGQAKSHWLKGKAWSVAKQAGRGAKIVAKKIGPGGLALCAIGAGWAWYRSDAKGWVRVGDAVSGCLL
ncbi:MFS transporter [Bifidobacterium italicum]|uniref:MFS transporter n=1 Tax=Bifidobacterium italicum TaxID=1960968 RepID=A0A2A2EM59_9BIFI|nr:MFS transporter [Bifidobacterium italicum]